MTDLLKLAERVEAATGPDRGLEYEIALALNFPNWRELKPWEKTNGWAKPNDPVSAWACLFYDSGGNPDQVPNYTASLDAAMTLVPKGWRLRQMNFSAPCADDRKWHLNLHGGRVGEDCFVGQGSSQILALCAAALRALAKVGRHNIDAGAGE